METEVAAHTQLVESTKGLRRLSHADATDRPSTDFILTEVLDRDDARIRSMRMKEAIKAEVDELIARGTFKAVEKRHVCPQLNVFP